MAGNGGDSQKLAYRHERFLIALLDTGSIIAAARAVGIGETTARRWLQLPHVREQYREMRRQVVDRALAQSQSAMSAAVVTLVRNLKSESGSVQVRAATAIIEHAIKAVELGDLTARIEALEEQAAARRAAPLRPVR